MQNSKFRQEHDSLGPVQVPSQALYGAQTCRALQNFQISGRTVHAELIRAYLRIKSAAARANQASGVLTSVQADLICHAVDELLKTPEAKWPEIFPVDFYQAGAGTSQNMNLNEVVANVANRNAGAPLGTYQPIHPNDHVNRSQSTNDTYPTAMRLALLDASARVLSQIENLAQAFEQKAAAWADIPKSGRTHLQDAVPMRLGQEIGAYAAVFRRCARWVKTARTELCELGIGGSAVGTAITVPSGYAHSIIAQLSDLTGEPLRLAADLREAMQSQSPVAYYSSMLKLTGLEVTRVCNDLRLLASGPLTGLGEIILPAVQPGSSIMPGKVNPSILEMCNQAWFSILGMDQTVAYATQAGQLELNVMMPIMAYATLEASRVAANSLETLRIRCIDGLEPNVARLKYYFESTPQVATALSPALGYEETAKLVQESLRTGQSVVAIVRERKLLPEAKLKQLLDLSTLTGD